MIQLSGNRPRRRSATLVEIMVALLLLTIIIIAGAAYLTHSGASVAIQRNRRAAVEIANQRLEALRAAAFEAITPSPATPNYSTYYLSLDAIAGWQISQADPGETVLINGAQLPIVTTVQYMDADEGTSSYDYLRLAVRVQFRRGLDEYVVLETRRAPEQL